MTTRGYVVHGKDRQLKSADVWAMADGVSMVRERAKLYGDVGAAVGAWAELRRCLWCVDVRILAVHADGTETPLPPYEETLAQLAAIEAAIPSSVVATHTEHGAPMGLAARVRILAVEATCEAETAKELAAARAEIERLRADLAKAETIRALARRLIQGSDLSSTNGTRAGVTCDEEPYAALVDIFEAEREAARLIPGLVCVECDQPIYRGQEYAGKGGHAAHRACRNWPSGTVLKVAGAQEGAAS